MINKKNEINYEKIISSLTVGDYIPDDNYEFIWIIDEIYKKYNKYCKCHLKFIGSDEEYEEEEYKNHIEEQDLYDQVKVFTYHDIAEAIKNVDDHTFDLETAFKEILNIE